MMRNKLYLLLWLLPALCSCGGFWTPRGQGSETCAPGDSSQLAASAISEAGYMEKVDEYVSSVRESIEQTSILKKEDGGQSMVIFVKGSDTVKISVLGDSEACTDIYFNNSAPVFITRHIILDVDSNYLETAYFKDGKIFKSFRDGQEIKDPAYLLQFVETLGNK